MSGRVHRLTVRVYYEDTDFSGVVYHANYLRFLERGRTETLRDAGLDHASLFAAEPPLALAVARMEIDFRRPARMDDLVEVETRVAASGGASLVMHQRLLRGDDVLVEATVRVAAVSRGRATRLPAGLAARLAG
ncbi:tol-pal system-associated acyl-CoA thioesterase [Lichenibacterium ramalinae]|uniref:Tol-pal system-associated acyl-CoA thioesterase n=1 Tax=Lichenibacterium ramalinae TaxID=2316527 RepID=A0A4Q2RGN9_9HYPH|nr:tol-pal system-associated acyl-CoA thioesterase [Lichenibacterium ramalinae]RYB07133.1 tol-pal system-associated acyl-CoA thioesterase [Lichenibacterium ramalinae]